MKDALGQLKLSAVCALLFVGGCASLPRDIAQGVVNRWSTPSAAVGRKLLDQYGLPDDVTINQLTWDRRNGWKRIVVWNRAPIYRSTADLAVMKHTVAYRLDLKQTAQLLAFNENLEIDLSRGELSSRTGQEGLNYLTVNLADEIVRGLKTVPQAQAAYSRIVALTAAGKSSPYTERLLFATNGSVNDGNENL